MDHAHTHSYEYEYGQSDSNQSFSRTFVVSLLSFFFQLIVFKIIIYCLYSSILADLCNKLRDVASINEWPRLHLGSAIFDLGTRPILRQTRDRLWMIRLCSPGAPNTL
jgi:hypothetical protein